MRLEMNEHVEPPIATMRDTCRTGHAVVTADHPGLACAPIPRLTPPLPSSRAMGAVFSGNPWKSSGSWHRIGMTALSMGALIYYAPPAAG
jgi:hypothetical protein